MTFSGDSRWLLLHVACLDYNTKPDELAYLFNLIKSTLSSKCTGNLDDFLHHNPIPLTHGHYTRFCWSVDLHNHVNSLLDRPLAGYEEIIGIYAGRRYCDL